MEKNIFELNDAQKALIEPHVKQIIKSAFLAGVEYSKAVAANSENKIDDIVVPAVMANAEPFANELAAKVKL